MPNSNPTETRIATLYLDDNGILIITMKDCGKVDELDVLDVNLAIRYKTQGEATYKLFDARANWSMSKKAKERAELENSVSKTKARAIVVSNIVKATLLKFMQSFSNGAYPQQIFTNKDLAYSWLLELKSKAVN